MYRLSLLGGVLLEGPQGPATGPAVQQRRLALLALLGSAGDRGRSRDQLISLLWPETDASEARQHLSHSLYAIRQALGEDLVRTSGEYLRISPSQLAVDSLAFETALHRGDREAAARTYAGPFMDGFFINHAAEFEYWVDSERRRLASVYASTLEDLACESSERGDETEAANWWGLLVEHDPYNTAAVIRLMEALASAADPANAIRYAQDHLMLLESELGMGPPEQVVAKIEELKGAGAGAGRDSGTGHSDTGPTVALPTALPAAPEVRRPLGRAVIAGVMVVAAGAILWSTLKSRGSDVQFVPNAVMVRAFENLTGDSTLDAVGRYATYILERSLAGIDTVRVVTADDAAGVRRAIERADRVAGAALTLETARQMRTGLVIENSIYDTRDSVRLEARVIDVGRGEVVGGAEATAAATNPMAGVQVLIDRILVVVATRLRLGDAYWDSYGRGQLYLAWQQVDAARELWLERGREREALGLLYQALAIDSTFDAAVGLAMIWHLNFGEYPRADSLAGVLDDRIALIPPRQRWQLAVNKAVLRRDGARLLQAFRDWKDRLPNASRWLHLAMAEVTVQRPRACLDALGKVDLEGSRYASSGWLWELYSLCHLALGDAHASLELAREGREEFPEDMHLVRREVQALAALGRIEEAGRLVDQSLFEPADDETFPHEWIFGLLVDPGLQMKARGFPEGSAEALERAVSWYRGRLVGDSRSAADRWRLARALYAAGRWEEARDEFSALSPEELVDDRRLMHHNIDVSLLGYEGTLAARLGDEETAARIDERLAHLRRPYLWGHADYWRSAIAAARGNHEQAVDLLGTAMTRGLFADPWGAEYPKWDYRIDPDFEMLRDYPPFQELIAPRG